MRKILDSETKNLSDKETKEITEVIKPKRQISEAQREHLNKIRELAMQKKKELKEITLKSKLAKTVPKQDLAKQYDEYVENKVKLQTKKKEEESVSDDEVIIKKKSKPKKKIVYVSESESEEEVVVRKPKSKAKPQPQPLENLVYNNNRDQLYSRMIEERVKNSILAYGAALGV